MTSFLVGVVVHFVVGWDLGNLDEHKGWKTLDKTHTNDSIIDRQIFSQISFCFIATMTSKQGAKCGAYIYGSPNKPQEYI